MEQNPDAITFFAKTNFRNREVPFGIKTDDRRRHMYIIGKTGMGKTTMMENMAIQDIRNGNGVCFIDPHGDSVAKILDFIPPSRINDVIYFNPSDLANPVAFNVMESVDDQFKHLVADGLMGVFTKIWANLWSSRMEYILNNTVRALLDSPGNTILGITRMYLDKKYRKKIVENIQDPMVKLFWTDEYANYDPRYVKEAVAPIQNKVGQFLSSAIIRNIVGQPNSTIDLRKIMDEKKILLVDISKGKIGEDNSALLGAMLVTKLQMAALSRVDIPKESDRPDFYLYVDEFQNFATESFATILSEARKYHLNLIMGHQYIAQLSPDKNNTRLRDAIFGNVGTIVCFRVGAADAEYLETEFAPIYTPNDLVNLTKWDIILKLMINGISSEPFSAHSIPVNPSFETGNSQKVIAVSRERYGNPLSVVQDRIARWMGSEYTPSATGEVSNANLETTNNLTSDLLGLSEVPMGDAIPIAETPENNDGQINKPSVSSQDVKVIPIHDARDFGTATDSQHNPNQNTQNQPFKRQDSNAQGRKAFSNRIKHTGTQKSFRDSSGSQKSSLNSNQPRKANIWDIVNQDDNLLAKHDESVEVITQSIEDAFIEKGIQSKDEKGGGGQQSSTTASVPGQHLAPGKTVYL